MAQAILDFLDNASYSTAEEPSPKHTKTKKLKTDEIQQESVTIVHISQTFPKQPSNSFLASMLEYRIKIQSKVSSTLEPGESKNLETNLVIMKKPNNLAMHIKKADNHCFHFAEGFINPAHKGPIAVYVENTSKHVQFIPAGSIIAYLILSPYFIP